MTIVSPELQSRYGKPARIVAIVGAAIMVFAPMVPWVYTGKILDDMRRAFDPSGLQILFELVALVLLGVLVTSMFGVKLGKYKNVVAWNSTALAASLGGLGYIAAIVLAVAVVGSQKGLGGLAAAEPGLWIALAGSVIASAGSVFLRKSPRATLAKVPSPAWVQILALVAVVAMVLFMAAFAVNLTEVESFLVCCVFIVAAVFVFRATGVMGWLSIATANNRKVLMLAAFAAAFIFPATQDGSDANMTVVAQVLIFAGTALGLNIVVGLAGLLDMGYIAFLGAGAFTAAVLSRSAYATFSIDLPFPVVVLISGTVAALFGLLIGSPTLRVSGDYLAIVTLAFGEIFRITMVNLDGTDGPNITHGSNGIPAIPNLDFFGFDFGKSHEIFGITITRQANYYLLLLVVIAIVIAVFANLNHSRIGRGWVAIREDEMAAEAMGVNTFTLKLLAFAGGAFLAGMVGAVKAYKDTSVTPDQFVFLESCFLLSAVVLGGMGTVMGVLIGATILKLLPEKLRFFDDYRMLIFGALLVVMMRFRPEGIVADERRQMEFHDEDEELADEVEEELVTHHDLLNPEGGK
ncbi:MAG: branched-chain amino acid ABC transporter permease [Propionibacteriaceae bacterium]|jgi:branched-chain amino acid transport system permease protein|nr:branched-chain amino acid ABC transporter permease [Propionibacteriaceae bacterium]